jgi:hypothetical protein
MSALTPEQRADAFVAAMRGVSAYSNALADQLLADLDDAGLSPFLTPRQRLRNQAAKRAGKSIQSPSRKLRAMRRKEAARRRASLTRNHTPITIGPDVMVSEGSDD